MRWLVPMVALAAACSGPFAERSATAPVVSAVPDPVPHENAGAWWTRPAPCPGGAVLVGEAGVDLTCHLPDGRRHGPSSAWEGEHRLVDGGYQRGKQHGLWTWYGGDGIVTSQGRWVDGLKDGLWRRWSPEGELISHYQMARGTGAVVLLNDDGTSHRGSTVDGKKHGRWVQLAADGSVIGEYTMEHGTGVEREWWPGGRLRFESVWEDGVWLTAAAWDPQGQLTSELVMAPDGSGVEVAKIYRDGQLVETIDYQARRAEQLRDAMNR